MKLVLIEWLDAHAGRGWQTIERIEQAAEPLYCRSVGWLLRETKECKVIAPHLAGEKNPATILQASGDLTIPTRCITRLTVLKR